jgi:hypothetical protein
VRATTRVETGDDRDAGGKMTEYVAEVAGVDRRIGHDVTLDGKSEALQKRPRRATKSLKV